MILNEKLLIKVNYLLDLADKTVGSKYTSGRSITTELVNSELFKEFQSLTSSFILNLYGKDHPYFKNFEENVYRATPHCATAGRGILKSIKTEIEKGWLIEIKALISAEIFSDFLEMAKYLLDEGYKDPAAVMIGSTLEENLRQVAMKLGIELTFLNAKGDSISKKADALNSEIAKTGFYSKLDQKQITAWLDLRNKAAHGLYDQYTKEQVSLMHDGILNFITRIISGH